MVSSGSVGGIPWHLQADKQLKPKFNLDNGWPESAEEQVTLVLLEVVYQKNSCERVDPD